MKKIGIIGGGPAGVMAGIVTKQSTKELGKKVSVTILDKAEPLKTLLYTGGGRCNLSYAEYDFRKLVKFFPRGEKFLLSPFSKFGVADTQRFFLDISVKTYIQDDNRIFPVSNSAQDMREIMLKKAKSLGIEFRKFEVQEVKEGDGEFVVSNNNTELEFDKIIIATGGNRLKPEFSGYGLAKSLGHSITKLRPALCGLKTKEEWVKKLSGLSLRDVKAKAIFNNKVIKELEGDLLFTHRGISGPLSYKASSYCAYCDFNKKNPLILEINFIDKSHEVFDKELIQKINENPKKNLLNIIIEYIPKSLAEALLNEMKIKFDTKAGNITKEQRKALSSSLTKNQLHITATGNDGEVVTAGGVNLKEIDGRTMESKLVKNLYFCGEVLDVDGLTGGFNLQACWSTGYVAGNSLFL